MNRALDARLQKLEAGGGIGRPHIIWADGMSDADMEVEIERRRAAGTLCSIDKILFVRWKTSARRTHEDWPAELEVPQ